jgi:heme-degrading monooxygenase HmoA
MFVRIWRYRVRPGLEARFEAAYGPAGAWVQLFRAGVGYLGTELLQDVATPSVYVTIDRWESRDAWTTFHEAHRDSYESLDRACEGLTTLEESLGDYTEPSGRA